MGRLNEAQRHRAVGMVEGGLSFREVARRMGCSHQTIMKLVERNAATGSVSDRQRPGRQIVTVGSEHSVGTSSGSLYNFR